MTRTASCSCGAFRAICEGEPARVSVCHCLACQQRTGSAFGAQARFADEQVVTEGPSNRWVRVGDEGMHATFEFCPTCGATVLWRIAEVPGWTAVAVGAFADNSFPGPIRSVYEERMHPWVGLAGIEEHEA